MPGKVIDRNLKLIKEKTGIYAEYNRFNNVYANGFKRVKRLITAKEANILQDLLNKKDSVAIDNFIYLYL